MDRDRGILVSSVWICPVRAPSCDDCVVHASLHTGSAQDVANRTTALMAAFRKFWESESCSQRRGEALALA
jgi:hypothetical protein